MKSFNVFSNRVSWTAPYHVNLPLIRAAMHLNIRSHLNVKPVRDGSIFCMWREHIGKFCVRFAQVERIPIQWHVCSETMCVSFSISTDCSEFSVSFNRLVWTPFHHQQSTVSIFFLYSTEGKIKKNQQTNEIHRRNIQCENEKYPKYIEQTGSMYSVREGERRNWKWKIVRSMDSGKSRSCRQSRARHE